jgi:1-acyl-sn-glycerol-3-phosphate acyltransferase
VQLGLGFLCKAFFCLPFQRETLGLGALERRRYLFVCNHVSLFDTILLGGILWWAARLPILVLGDRSVWRKNWIRRALSARLGFLIDREHLSRDVIRQLRCYGRSIEGFNLIVFPEGHRGDGQHVQECLAGVPIVAREANVPIVPIFIENMQLVSSRTTPFRPLRGLRKIRVHFGRRWEPEEYLALEPDTLRSEMRRRIQELAPRE